MFRFFSVRLGNIGNQNPYYVNYDITSKCTQKCEHCYFYKSYNGRKDLTSKEWEEIFNKHYREGARSIYLTGGEPFLRPDVVKMADKIFPQVTIISNGTLKMPKDIQRRILVSIDGPKEIHNKIRGVNCFDKIIKNIKGDKRVVLTPCISTSNYKYIKEIVRIAKDAGVSGVMFSLYTSHIGKDDPLYLKEKELDKALSLLEHVRRTYGKFVFITKSMIKAFKEKEYYKTCPMSKANPRFLSYYPDLKKKIPCTLGEGVKCETCGCIAPVIPYLLKKFNLDALFMISRLYPPEYSPY